MVVAAIVVAASVSLGWCLLATRLGPALGLVDLPDADLKVHRSPAVPLGGVGLYLGVFAGLVVAGWFEPGLAVVALAVLLLGLADDRLDLPPGLRLAGEVVVAVGAVWLATPLSLASPLEAMAGVGLVIVAVNAVNLFDGLDGLAATAGLVSALGLAALAWQKGVDPSRGLLLAAALAGFLVLNWHVARVFLGDNGAYLLGLLLAVGILRQGEGVGVSLAVGCVVLGVFVVDLVATVIRRARSGRPLFAGDRSHLYDRLRDRGWSVPRIAVTAGAVQVGFVAVAVLLDRLSSLAAGLGVVGLIGAVFGVLAASGVLAPDGG